jgi:hypothetical protein
MKLFYVKYLFIYYFHHSLDLSFFTCTFHVQSVKFFIIEMNKYTNDVFISDCKYCRKWNSKQLNIGVLTQTFFLPEYAKVGHIKTLLFTPKPFSAWRLSKLVITFSRSPTGMVSWESRIKLIRWWFQYVFTD